MLHALTLYFFVPRRSLSLTKAMEKHGVRASSVRRKLPSGSIFGLVEWKSFFFVLFVSLSFNACDSGHTARIRGIQSL